MSRPSSIAVGSTTVFTPWPLTASADSSASAYSRSWSRTCGHCAETASSEEKKCSWMSVRPSSSASIGPVTVCTVVISLPWVVRRVERDCATGRLRVRREDR